MIRERLYWIIALYRMIALCLLLGGCGGGERSYPLLEGGRITAADMAGKVVLINYWAVWCQPCRLEIPELNTLLAEHGDKVLVLGVNFDGVTGDKLAEQVAGMGIEFPVLLSDPRPDYGAASSGVLPETLVIDQRGKFQKVLLGPQSVAGLLQLVASLQEETPYETD